MDYAQTQRTPAKNLSGIALVVLLHIAIGYALVTGLARKVIEVIKAPLETKIIEEIKKPPPDLPPPPPPKMAAPPPPFIPPPEINIQVPLATPPPTITTQSTTPPPPQQVISEADFAMAEAAEAAMFKERFSGFDTPRACVMAAWLFPELRPIFAEAAIDDGIRRTFLDSVEVGEIKLVA